MGNRAVVGLGRIGMTCIAAKLCVVVIASSTVQAQTVVGKCAFVDFEAPPGGAFNPVFYNASSPGNWFVGTGPGAGVRFFSVPNAPCPAPPVVAAINTPFPATATKVLKAGTCPTGSVPACICIVFNENQRHVTFDVYQPMLDAGVIGSVRINVYSDPNCGSPTGLLAGYPITVAIAPGFGSPTQSSAAKVKLVEDCNIRRIEVCPVNFQPRFEPTIDNLAWGVDASPPPNVRIDSPQYLDCYCPNDFINILGVGCDTTERCAFP